MKRPGLTSSTDAHRQCWDLLPWLANERVSSKDVAHIEEHLRGCELCQGELQAQRQLRDAVRSEEAVVLAPQTSLQKLMQRIDGIEAPSPERATGESRAHQRALPERPFMWRRSSWFAVAAAIQGMAIAALLGALWWQSREMLLAPRFTTLTTHASVSGGAVLRVVLAADTAVGDLGAMLRSIEAQIVAGPSDAGVYTLSLPADASHPRQIQQALTALRADRRVLFAESALTRAESP